MIQTKVENPVGRASSAIGLSDHLTDSCKNVMEAADAQLAICTLKTTRATVLVAFCIAGITVISAVALYSLYLLDGALAYALSQPPLPAWFAALARGLFYLLISAGALACIFHTMVGFRAGENRS